MDEFQKHALQSVALPKGDITALSHRTLGIVGEAGVLANQIKKIIRDRDGQANEQDLAIIEERLGDVLYYVAVTAEYFDLNLSDIANANRKKSDAFKANRG